MLALLRWSSSGNWPPVSAPSSACASTGSAPSNPPLAAVKPIGASARWSWNVFAYQNSWVALNSRLAVLVTALSSLQEQNWLQKPGCPSTGSYSQLGPALDGSTLSPSSGSAVSV